MRARVRTPQAFRRHPWTTEYLIIAIIFTLILYFFGWLGELPFLIFSVFISLLLVLSGIYEWRVVIPNYADRERLREESWLFYSCTSRDPEYLTMGKWGPFKGKPERDWKFRRSLYALFVMTAGAFILYIALTRYLIS